MSEIFILEYSFDGKHWFPTHIRKVESDNTSSYMMIESLGEVPVDILRDGFSLKIMFRYPDGNSFPYPVYTSVLVR